MDHSDAAFQTPGVSMPDNILKMLPEEKGARLCDHWHDRIHREFSRKAWRALWFALTALAALAAIQFVAHHIYP
jgi:hypothetical protein